MTKSAIANQTELISDSGPGLHEIKSMHKFDLHNCMYDVSCHLKTF